MFDINKIKNAATKLGLDVTFGSSSPGMHFHMPDGTVDVFTYDELKRSLHDEFTSNTSKSTIQYNLKTENPFSIDIHSQSNIIAPSTTINRIEVSISGHHKISRKNEPQFKDIQLLVGNSNLEAS